MGSRARTSARRAGEGGRDADVSLAEAVAVAGVVGLTLGGVLAARPGRLGAGLAAQAAGTALLGACGVAVLVGGDPMGAEFRSDVAPAFGLDPLSGFFLVVLAIPALPALAFARPYLSGGSAPRAVGSLTAAFLLALTGLVAARDVTTFLGFWELMTLVPAAAILAARREAPVR
jgi:hydrogenase-4 component B